MENISSLSPPFLLFQDINHTIRIRKQVKAHSCRSTTFISSLILNTLYMTKNEENGSVCPQNKSLAEENNL